MKIWWQGYASQYTQSAIDSYLEMIDGKIDVILAAVRPDNDNAVWFDSELTPKRSERINGMLPGHYLIQQAHKRDIKVQAWFYVGYWYTYSGMYIPPNTYWNMATLSGADCNAVNWINYSIEPMREFAANYMADIYLHNDFDGLNLDYLRLHVNNGGCDSITFDHVTDVAQKVRDKVGLSVDMSACFGRSKANSDFVRRDVSEWLRPGLFNSLQCMAYDWPPERQWEILGYIETLPENNQVEMGLGTVSRSFADGPVRDGYELFSTNYGWWLAHGFDAFHIFDLPNLTQPMLDLLPAKSQPVPDYGLLSQLHSQAAKEQGQLSQIHGTLSSIHNNISEEYNRLSNG